MIAKSPTKPRRTLLQEATDPATDPERLRELARQDDDDLRRAAWRNPSVPEDVWRDAFLEGFPESWANPMAPIYVLTWTSESEQGENDIANSARWAAQALWENPERCSTEGKALINAKVQEWWGTSKCYADHMMSYLGWWAQEKGNGSPEHREVLRITIRYVRILPDLTVQDRQALHLLEVWSTGGEDRRNEADRLAYPQVIADTVLFAQDPSHGPENALWEVRETLLNNLNGMKLEEAEAKYERLLADLIRRAMPLPPVVA